MTTPPEDGAATVNAQQTTPAASTKNALRERLMRAAEAPKKAAAPRKAVAPRKRSTTKKAASAPPATATPAPLRRPEFPDTPASQIYSKRIPLDVTPQMARALDEARLEDGITRAARLRAMIEIWMEGRAAIDPETNELRPASRHTKSIDTRARRHRG